MPNNKSFENIKLFKAFGFSAYKIRDYRPNTVNLVTLFNILKMVSAIGHKREREYYYFSQMIIV